MSTEHLVTQICVINQQVGRVLPGPAGKLQELAAAGALQQATPEALGLNAGSTAGISPSQAASQFDAAFLSSSWAAAKARAEEDEVVAGGHVYSHPPHKQNRPAGQHTGHTVLRVLLLKSVAHCQSQHGQEWDVLPCKMSKEECRPAWCWA